ncbi:starry night [Carabus blaptoides fortunei]
MHVFIPDSPVISLSILVPEYVEVVTKPSLENSAYLREETLSRHRRDEYELSKNLMYKSLSGIPLNQPITIQLALDTDRVIFNERKGEWSVVGCRTELDENCTDKGPLMINCTRNHLSSFAILVDVIDLEFPCKLVAIALHYHWLCVFSWNLVDSVHLYRILTEMHDINHGQMPFYVTMGYVLPAVVLFVILIRKCCMEPDRAGIACINLAVLALSIHAAFTLQDHVMRFGILRTLLWLSVISLLLLVMMWVLMASDHSPMLTYLLSLAVLVHAMFSILGYCFVNTRVPLLETTSVIGGASTSSHDINMQSSRSALAYHSSTSAFEASSRRHSGILTSSTTSRFTTKTGSSPYRSDTHLRQNTTSTSTSNYNSRIGPTAR